MSDQTSTTATAAPTTADPPVSKAGFVALLGGLLGYMLPTVPHKLLTIVATVMASLALSFSAGQAGGKAAATKATTSTTAPAADEKPAAPVAQPTHPTATAPTTALPPPVVSTMPAPQPAVLPVPMNVETAALALSRAISVRADKATARQEAMAILDAPPPLLPGER